MNYNEGLDEKLSLEQDFIRELTGGAFTQGVMYYTTIAMPFLKNFENYDWKTFFNERITKKTGSNTWSVVIDV